MLLHHTESEFLSFLAPLTQQRLLEKPHPHSEWELSASLLFF